MRRQRRKRRLLKAALGVALALILLSGPLGTWVQSRGRLVAPETHAGAVYLVAGARAQDRRVDAAVGFVSAMTNRVPVVLIGNDELASRWSSDDQRNLTMGEWAVRKVSCRLDEKGRDVDVRLLDGGFGGTHREMEILAGYLDAHPEISTLALVTSPYHARRCVKRLETRVDGKVVVHVVPVEPSIGDRAPWIVAAELAKMIRDSLGLGNCPFLTRRGWRRLFRMLGLV